MSIKILILLLFVSSLSFSKNEGNIWYFGANCGLDFNNAEVRVLNGSKLNSKEACATFCDEKGEVILYSDGVSLWNKNHNRINDNLLMKGNQSATQGVLIVPSNVRNSGKQIFYIYTAINLNKSQGLNKYTIEYDNSNPDNSKIINEEHIADNISEKLIAFPFINSNGLADYVIAFQSNYLNNYHIGFYYNNSIKYSDISGSNLYSNITTNTVGYLRYSQDGKKLACVISLDSTIEIYDFDSQNISLSNRINIKTGKNKSIYGLEFFGSDYLLYTIDSPNSEINIIDLKTNKINNISNINLPDYYGAIAFAPDSNFYVACPNSDSIIQISPIKEKDNYIFNINKSIKLNNVCNIGLPNQLPNQQRDLHCNNIIYNDNKYNKYNQNIFVGDAKNINKDNNYIKLNPLKINTIGGVYFGEINDINSGFEINCKFRIYNGDNRGSNDGSIPGADGIAFAITSEKFDSTKYKAGFLGYEGLNECIAIEYDTFKNGPFADPNGNHISVMSNGLNPISTKHNFNLLEKTNDKIDIISGDSAIYSSKIIYQNNNIIVYFNKGEEVLKEVINIKNINIKSLLNLNNEKKLYFTLFGGTGIAIEDHEITQLSLCQLSNDSLEINNSIESNNISNNIILNIYPNPIENETVISISNCKSQNTEVNIYDLLGRKIKNIYSGEINDYKQIKYNFGSLQKGIYLLEFKSESRKIIEKIVVE